MSRNGKIILSAVVAIAAVSMLFAVVPINETFIVSYIFADIAICFVAGTVYAYGKGSAKAAAGLSYIYTSVIYAALSVMFSLVACIVSLPLKWILTVHIILLAVFAIRIITSSAGSDYINELDKKAEEKHNEFVNEKKDYWR